MLKGTFIKKLCRAVTPSREYVIYDEEVEDKIPMDSKIDDKIVDIKVNTEFYTPSQIVMQKIKNREPLSKSEIEEYVTYIINNYYVSNYEKSVLDDFCVEWSRNQLIDENLVSRRNIAISTIVRSLKNGYPIEVMDALWVSEKIFVDDENIRGMRIITKTNNSQLSVATARVNSTIPKQILTLKRELCQKNVSKQLDNNY